MAFSCFMFLFHVWIQLVFNCVRAETSCRNEHISRINISTELQSDVLLPCIFNSSLLGSDLTADIAAVWIYKNITEENLVEISLKTGAMFWNNRGGRIKTFTKLSSSGNFSILLHKLNKSDTGLYRCELFNGFNCSIAYQEMSLVFRDSPEADGLKTVLITAAALGGGIVVLSLLLIIWFCSKRNKNTRVETGVCSTLHHSHTEHTECQYTLDNPIYDTFIQTETNNRAKEEDISPDAPIYAIVKKKKKSTNTQRNQTDQAL